MAQIACTFRIEYHPEIFSAQISHIWMQPGRSLKSIFSNIKNKFYGSVFSCYCCKARYSIDKIIPRLPIHELFNVYHQAQQSTLFLNIVINPDGKKVGYIFNVHNVEHACHDKCTRLITWFVSGNHFVSQRSFDEYLNNFRVIFA